MGEEKRIKDLAAASSITNNDYLAMDNANNSAAKKTSAMPLKNVQGSDDAYSTTKDYKVGDLGIRNNQLYRCNTDCAAGSWGTNSGYFDAVTLTDAVTQLNNDLSKHTFGTSQSLTKGITFTCTSDGYIKLQCPPEKASVAYAAINGISKFLRLASENGYGQGMGDAFSEVVFVRKGTTVLFENGSSANASCTFYPLT